MENQPLGRLTAKQAADVIRYYHDNENSRERMWGWKDKVSLGLAALHATRSRHSILPDGQPTLTADEMGDGLSHIKHPLKSPGYHNEADIRVNERGISYVKAYSELDEEGWM